MYLPHSHSPLDISGMQQLVAFHEFETSEPVLMQGEFSNFKLFRHDVKKVGIVGRETSGRWY